MFNQQHNFTRSTHFIERILSNIWVIPLLMTAAALMLSFILFRLNFSVSSLTPSKLFDYQSAKTILITLSSLMMAILSISLSIIIVMLSTSSNQVGPRLLKSILKQSKVQICLAFFIAAFVFCVSSLLLIRWDNVYLLTLICAITIAVLSAFVLIYLIEHVRKSIQIDSLIEYIIHETTQSIQAHFVKKSAAQPSFSHEERQDALMKSTHQKKQVTLVASNAGYLQTINYDELFKLACEHNLTIEVLHRPGQYVWKDLAFAHIWSDQLNVDSAIVKSILACCEIGIDRTIVQDVEFGFEQLAEIAIRSLSPSTANPFTAINAIDRLFYGISFMANYACPPAIYTDPQFSIIRLAINTPTVEGILSVCFDRVAQQAATDLLVAKRLLQGIKEILTIKNCQTLKPFLLAFSDDFHQQFTHGITSTAAKEKLNLLYHQLKTRHYEDNTKNISNA